MVEHLNGDERQRLSTLVATESMLRSQESSFVGRYWRIALVVFINYGNDPVFHGGGTRPNNRFRELCSLAGIEPKTNVENGEEEVWVFKNFRKTCSTYYDQHVPESSVEIPGHSAGGVTNRRYVHLAPLAFKAIMTIPQPSAFSALSKGFDDECPCCMRRFNDAVG
jgi:hypothetical protein